MVVCVSIPYHLFLCTSCELKQGTGYSRLTLYHDTYLKVLLLSYNDTSVHLLVLAISFNVYIT